MNFFDNVDVFTSRSIHHTSYVAIFYIFILLAYNVTCDFTNGRADTCRRENNFLLFEVWVVHQKKKCKLINE